MSVCNKPDCIKNRLEVSSLTAKLAFQKKTSLKYQTEVVCSRRIKAHEEQLRRERKLEQCNRLLDLVCWLDLLSKPEAWNIEIQSKVFNRRTEEDTLIEYELHKTQAAV